MESNERQALKEVLLAWYGPQITHWEMTDDVLNLVIEMMQEMRSCTTAMLFVPEPVTFGNVLTQLAKSTISRFVRQLKDNALVYKACGNQVLLNYKSRIAMAGMGY